MQKGIFYRFATESATEAGASTADETGTETGFVLETNQKHPYKLASLSDAKGDLKKRWHVSFYVWHKHEGKLIRKRIFISSTLKSKAARYREADKIIREINRLLQSGYIIGEKPHPQRSVPTKIMSFLDAFIWVQQTRKGEIRDKSLQTFDTVITNLREYVQEKKLVNFPVHLVDRDMCEDFMTWVKIKRGIANNTYNNYLSFLKGYFSYLVDKGRLLVNPAENLKTLRKTEPINAALPPKVRKLLMEAYIHKDPGLAVFAQYIFYTFIRPTELRKLRVENVLSETIFIPGHISKNRKSEHVLISPGLEKLIQELGVRDYPPSYYLIGLTGKPSSKMVAVNTFSHSHVRIRRQLALDEMYKLYCWKHTGVVEMYKATKDLEFVSRHCRHSSLDMTKKYLRGLGLMIDYKIMDQLPVLKL